MMTMNPLHKAPSYRLVVDGKDITPKVNGRLISLTLTDNRGNEADILEIVLSDHDGAMELPPHGATISVALGWQGEDLLDKGTYIVDETEHSGPPDEVTIRARSVDLRRDLPGKKSRSWHRTTLGEIISQIAREHSLEPVISDSLVGIRRPDTQQMSESDISLLTRLGKLYDAIVAVKNNKLLFILKSKGTTVTGKLLPAITLQRSDGDQHRYSLTERDAYTGVKAKWNDISGGQHRWVIAGIEDKISELQPTFASEQDALAAATAELRRIQRGKTSLKITLSRGHLSLMPETPIICKGWNSEISSKKWVVVNAVHSLNERELLTHFEAETLNAGHQI